MDEEAYITNAEDRSGQSETSNEISQLILPQIIETHQKVMMIIDDLEKKVEHIVKKNQSEFLMAYRNHMKKIKKELFEIKGKSEEQEKMFSSNDRIKYLQKQLAVFREESAQTYLKMSKKLEDLEIYRKKYEDIKIMYECAVASEKLLIKKAKVYDMKRAQLELKIEDLQKVIKNKQVEIQEIKYGCKSTKNVDSIQEKWNFGSLKSSQNHTEKSFSLRKANRYEGSQWSKNTNSEFRDFFFDCIKTVKRQISYRKSAINFNPQSITNIDDFRGIDKLRVIQLFLKNTQLENWMYEKLFPSKLLSQIDSSYQNKIILPKVKPNQQISTMFHQKQKNQSFL